MKTRLSPVTGSLFLLLVLAAMAGCSLRDGSIHTRPVSVPETSTAIPLSNSRAVQEVLLKQYQEWRGTPYRMGGLERSGIDCSGFAYITFRTRLGYKIPRTTNSQVLIGRYVPLRELRIGDLVFFKTSIRYNHVGIYLGDMKFLHASTSKGVMISGLNESYWKKRYWTARRVAE